MYKRILVATDGSTLSKKAVASAIELAAAQGAALAVLTVVPRYPTSYLDGAIAFTPEEIAHVEKQWAHEAREMLATALARAAEAGVKARAVVANSDHVAEAIVAAARKHRADLIVMASHGRRGLKRLLLGSETQHVLATSRLPVLVLR